MSFRSVNLDSIGGETLLYILEEITTGRKATNQKNRLKEVINGAETAQILYGYTCPNVRAHESKRLLVNNVNNVIERGLEKLGYVRARSRACEHKLI